MTHFFYSVVARSDLEKAGQIPATKQWLKPELDSSQGTEKVRFGVFCFSPSHRLGASWVPELMHRLDFMQMYTLLEHHIEQPEFLKKLEKAKDASRIYPPKEHGDEVLHEEWWEEPPRDSNSAPVLSEDFTEVRKALQSKFALPWRLPLCFLCLEFLS